MEKCSYCKNKALWSSQDSDLIVKFCRNCREIYMHNLGAHELTQLFQNILVPNATFKNMLQEKILLIMKELEKEKTELIASTNEMIAMIVASTKVTLNKLNDFENNCRKLLESFQSEIKFKEYYNPFENALVVSPIELLQKFERNFSIVLPYCMSNYSDLSMGIGKTKELIVFPSTVKLAKLPKFDCNYRFLNLGDYKILVTGGFVDEGILNNTAFVLNLLTGEKVNLPLLNFPRKSHCMTWIQGSPVTRPP